MTCFQSKRQIIVAAMQNSGWPKKLVERVAVAGESAQLTTDLGFDSLQRIDFVMIISDMFSVERDIEDTAHLTIGEALA